MNEACSVGFATARGVPTHRCLRTGAWRRRTALHGKGPATEEHVEVAGDVLRGTEVVESLSGDTVVKSLA
ncbi:hypothetical protein F441_21684 [Phytophthora nicotianae CJ01A1]|uniref:Uncharacterized protein n=2 Tax=Phytophthora nicotianae TaxID=4792 RepID=V9DY11_PHYNI|nr:hypothetical protein F443_21803 [Phytophthora nicotianae P1569]ETP01014.1 hypothetical protein F441_21684 [Phytophthora nicotianae CJ01A1]